MATIAESSFYVRSKGAGPFWFSIDIFCTPEQYEHFKQSDKLKPGIIAQLYKVPEDMISIHYVDNVNVVKISIPRIPPEGSIVEKDMHCGQQAVLVLDLEI